MKKRKLQCLVFMVLFISFIMVLAGCSTEAERVSYNLSQEADSFNIVRQLTIINCITNDTVLQMTGRISIQPDVEQNQLEIIVEHQKGQYLKDFVGLGDNVMYTVQQVDPIASDPYRYVVNYNPKMWIPVKFENVD